MITDEIPDAAKCTEDLDCVLLIGTPSYRSQIVKVAAHEAGLRWKPFMIDYGGDGALE